MNGSTNSLLLAMGDVRSNVNLTCFCLPTFRRTAGKRARERERQRGIASGSDGHSCANTALLLHTFMLASTCHGLNAADADADPIKANLKHFDVD